jgi:hypothetical protein
MSAHTPGPWLVANGNQIRSEKDQIAKVWMMRCGEGSANANLIALAPEMLAALEEINNVALGQPYAGCTCGEIARAILAKLKGEASCTASSSQS